MSTGQPPDRRDGERFRAIDDSLSTLLRQLPRATGHFLASLLALASAGRILPGGLGLSPAEYAVTAAVLTVFCGLAILVASALPIRKAITEQRRVIFRHEAEPSARPRRHEFSGGVHDALEMAEDEASAIEIVAHAMGEAWPGPGELLLADSSRAHLRRVAVSASGSAPGCPVSSPWSCPAVRRGQTL